MKVREFVRWLEEQDAGNKEIVFKHRNGKVMCVRYGCCDTESFTLILTNVDTPLDFIPIKEG
jgi:uncharacterized beta-barrel protein YwiB (DUF1934 family)